jgi:GT2 family glycosyltransferase
MSTQGVLIAVPFYRNEQLVAPLAAALARCADDIAAIRCELVFYDDSPEYAPLATALTQAAAVLGCRVEQNATNLGFVKTMNRAVAEAVASRRDLIILNSDTAPEPGAFSEMHRVAALESLHGFVNPRSNNATIATLPLHHRAPGGAPTLAQYQEFAHRLPDFSYVPTAVGFCMLIKWEILAELGGFDEIYGKGYNEENDLVMRAARLGYRAVLANHAFVWHEGEASFSTSPTARDEWERRNRAILDERYPEYSAHTNAFYDSAEFQAERLLSSLTRDAQGKLDIAFDCSSFVAAQNGTFQAGRQIIAAAAATWSDDFRIHVLCAPDVFTCHGFDRLGVLRAEPHAPHGFAAIFRVGQPYDWNCVERLCMSGAVLGIYMLDTISLDCPHLASQRLRNIWQFTADHADLFAAQSRQTELTLRLRLRWPPGLASAILPHSMDPRDYLADHAAPPSPGGTLLVVGNFYHHKYVAPTANALARAFPARRIVAFGVPPATEGADQATAAANALHDLPNLEGVSGGALEEAGIAAIYAAAEAVIFPSFAEGFGFPVMNALSMRRPLFARRLPSTLEIWEALGRTPNIHFYDTTAELAGLLADVPAWRDVPLPSADSGAPRAARALRAAIECALAGAQHARILARVQAMQFASDNAKHAMPTVSEPAMVAARLVAQRVERWALRALRIPVLFALARSASRAVRWIRGSRSG